MPWCPKCKAEYRPEKSWCPQCEEALVDEDPNPPKPRVRVGAVAEVAAVYLLAPWAWLLGGSLLRFAGLGADNALLPMLPLLPVFVIAFLYGYWRSTHGLLAAAVLGSVVGLGVELLAVAILENLGQPEAPGTSIIFVVIFGGISVPTVLAAWLGANRHLHRSQAQ